jgi:hypothetical protein
MAKKKDASNSYAMPSSMTDGRLRQHIEDNIAMFKELSAAKERLEEPTPDFVREYNKIRAWVRQAKPRKEEELPPAVAASQARYCELHAYYNRLLTIVGRRKADE